MSPGVEEDSKEVQGNWRRSRNTGGAGGEWRQVKTGEPGSARELEKGAEPHGG